MYFICEWFTYIWEVLKCGSGEEWRRYVGPIVCENEMLHGVREERNILCTN